MRLRKNQLIFTIVILVIQRKPFHFSFVSTFLWIPNKEGTPNYSLGEKEMNTKERISEAKLTLYMVLAAISYIVIDVIAITQSGFNLM
uniref:Uncharacterized protein n=1 Tax=Metallosphaera hakonensis JCM 8857 = DSM 7519 TaxID=1293036 RepID=A0A2U9IWZ8_9CREN